MPTHENSRAAWRNVDKVTLEARWHKIWAQFVRERGYYPSAAWLRQFVLESGIDFPLDSLQKIGSRLVKKGVLGPGPNLLNPHGTAEGYTLVPREQGDQECSEEEFRYHQRYEKLRRALSAEARVQWTTGDYVVVLGGKRGPVAFRRTISRVQEQLERESG